MSDCLTDPSPLLDLNRDAHRRGQPGGWRRRMTAYGAGEVLAGVTPGLEDMTIGSRR